MIMKYGKKVQDAFFLFVILLDSYVEMNKNFNLQILLEERKYAMKENQMKNIINGELKLVSPGDESDDGCDNESDNKYVYQNNLD